MRQAVDESDESESTYTLLSCLLDGELEPSRCESVFDRLHRDADALRNWDLMNIASDALHSSDVAAWHRDDFSLRLRAVLDAEPTVLAPGRARRHWQRWVGTGAAIAAAGVLIVVGMTQLQLRVDGGSSVAAIAPAPQPLAVATTGAPVEAAIERLPAMERYLAAHRELARPAVMPDSTPYLRTSATVRIERSTR